MENKRIKRTKALVFILYERQTCKNSIRGVVLIKKNIYVHTYMEIDII